MRLVKALTLDRRYIKIIFWSFVIATLILGILISLQLFSRSTIQENVQNPAISKLSVLHDQSVTIQGNNFPVNDTFIVTMGPMGTRGIGGIRVAETNTDNSGKFIITYSIPNSLKGANQIAIRLQSPYSGYFSYNLFDNRDSSVPEYISLPSNVALFIDTPNEMNVDDIGNIRVVLSRQNSLIDPPSDGSQEIGGGGDESDVCYKLYLDGKAFEEFQVTPDCFKLDESELSWPTIYIKPKEDTEDPATIRVTIVATNPDGYSRVALERDFIIEVYSSLLQRIARMPALYIGIITTIFGVILNAVLLWRTRADGEPSRRRDSTQKQPPRRKLRKKNRNR